MAHPNDGQPRDSGKKFAARPRAKSEVEPAADRTASLLEDMRTYYAEAQQIVGEGRESFLAPDNLRTRRWAESIVIHLADVANRKEIRELREAYPEVNWRELNGQRNVLSHQYDKMKFNIVWETISVHFPRERDVLGLG